jgi:hypothetical protein
MTQEKFDGIVDNTCKSIVNTLSVKGREYTRNNNPLHNFEVGATMSNQTREKVLYGFALKHLISLADIRNDIEKGKLPSLETIEEKFGDAINYLILEKASLIDRLDGK